jgi:hypothetical protein
MAQVLAKEYECLTCHELIKIAKLDNVLPGQKKKWQRFETDGVTPHKCKKQKEEERPVAPALHDGSQIAEVINQVKELKETVDILILQIQGLRSEVKEKCITE